MKKSKKDKIKYINKILVTYGSFSIEDLGYNDDDRPLVATLGNLKAFAENFTEHYVEVKVYTHPGINSDAIDEYDEKYENLSEGVLGEIELLCEYWEAQEIRTWERISN